MSANGVCPGSSGFDRHGSRRDGNLSIPAAVAVIQKGKWLLFLQELHDFISHFCPGHGCRITSRWPLTAHSFTCIGKGKKPLVTIACSNGVPGRFRALRVVEHNEFVL